uniref:hypothetical protein n=1 Tax=Herbidospora sakaeratensis TaxID=564415 RepID=UPI000A623700|nr:hypothetical protein [Herbidospora sakaeratensis]
MIRRIAVLLGALSLLYVPLPATAGGFASTELDPIPEIRPGVAYTIGYWVLALGTEPVTDEAFGETTLRFSRNGERHDFTGARLAEPSHYATSIILPAGEWKVEALLDYYGHDDIGTLTVPGGLVLSTPEYEPMRVADMPDPWGAIKPPGHPWGTPFRPVPGVTPIPTTMPAAAPAAGPETPGWPYALGGLAVAGGLVLLLRRRPARREPEEVFVIR